MEKIEEIKPKVIITPAQGKWLDDRGGRNINDVEADEKGLFVRMGDGYGGELKVRLPVKKGG